MLPRVYRLRKEQDIRRVLRRGKSVSTRWFRVRYVRRPSSPPSLPRFTFVVSKKVAKKATERNTLKRRMRAAVAAQLAAFPQQHDYMFVAQPSRTPPTYSQILSSVRTLLSQLPSTPVST